MKIHGVVAICSRGAVLTETLQRVEDQIFPFILTGKPWLIITTWTLPIPDAQNEITRQALSFDPEWVWYVEEDTVPPPSFLEDGIINPLEAEVVVADYPLEQGDRSVKYDKKKRIINSGMGCLLIRSSILREMEQPWFDNKTWILHPDGSYSASGLGLPYRQDVGFIKKIREFGAVITCKMAGQPAKHLRLTELGQRGTNNGLHTIKELR